MFGRRFGGAIIVAAIYDIERAHWSSTRVRGSCRFRSPFVANPDLRAPGAGASDRIIDPATLFGGQAHGLH